MCPVYTFRPLIINFFFCTDSSTTELYTLSLHDALPIYRSTPANSRTHHGAHARIGVADRRERPWADRKSTRLNSSHLVISYAVFCLKKKIMMKLHSNMEIDCSL